MKTEGDVFPASRRSLLRAAFGSVVVLLKGREALAQRPSIGSFAASRDAAYAFLDTMMDAYVTGATARLIQSYSDQSFAPYSPVSFTYDNAVVIAAYLARGTAADLQRAQVLGNGLVAAQSGNFPIADGRFAQGYYVNKANASNGAFITPASNPFYFYSSSVGDQAWAGMALAQLYNKTQNSAYLGAALRVANWIVANAYSTIGPGGFAFGTTINAQNQSVASTNGKSTEHNIDTYAFFRMLAALTEEGNAANGQSWASLAQHALLFVKAMFDADGGFFYTGTDGDQTTVATGNIPEDVQTWSFLALKDQSYSASIDWAKTHLVATDQLAGNLQISGATFASQSLTSQIDDPHAVWLEGTGHLAAAIVSRRLVGGRSTPLGFRTISDTAQTLLENIRLAQSKLSGGQKVNGVLIPGGQGIPASTSVLDTGFGFTYSPALHIGATGWYALALNGANPFQLA